MSSSLQTRLNRFPILRYDTPHADGSTSDLESVVSATDTSTGDEHMDVNGIGSIGRSFPISQTRPAQNAEPAAPASPISSPRDEVEISSVGKALDNLGGASALREQRLAQIRAAIADGTYETPEKLDLALSRLLDQHGLAEDS
jgi:negative regulator of flagellin synthesis FlgM